MLVCDFEILLIPISLGSLKSLLWTWFLRICGIFCKIGSVVLITGPWKRWGGGEGFVLPGFESHYMPMILDNFTVRGRGGGGG